MVDNKSNSIILIVSILAIIIPLVFGGGLFYKEYNQPNIVYQVLAPYQYTAENSVTAISVQNIGHSTAHDVLLKVNSNQIFSNFYIDSPEAYEFKKGWENNTEMVITFPRITNEITVIMYVTIPTENPDLSITVTSEEGKGRDISTTSGGLIDSMKFIILIITILIGLVGTLKSKYSIKISNQAKHISNEKILLIESMNNEERERLFNAMNRKVVNEIKTHKDYLNRK